VTPERLDEINGMLTDWACRPNREDSRDLAAMARECLRWRALGESPEAMWAELADDAESEGHADLIRAVQLLEAERDKLRVTLKRLGARHVCGAVCRQAGCDHGH
jgi:hypothetical protein